MQLLFLMITSRLAFAQTNIEDAVTNNTGPDYGHYLGTFALYAIGAAALSLTSRIYHSTNEYGSFQQSLKSSKIMAWFCIAPSCPQLAAVTESERENQGETVKLSYAIRLIGCFFGLQASYLSWGVLQERLMTVEYDGEKFVHSEALVLVNRMLACVIAIIVNKVMVQSTSSSPPYKYCICSMGNILSSWFQYEALKFVGFPLQVLSKSSKILFAMIMGKIVQEKSFPWSQYGVALVIMIGIAVFKIFDTDKTDDGLQNSQQAFGALMLLCYVGCDSFTSNYQKTVFDNHKINPYQMMLGINTASCSVLLVMLGLRGVLVEALTFFLAHPLAMLHACLMSICSASGQLFIFYTIKEFGVVVFSSIMTFRQLLAILLSIVYYGHVVTNGSWFGLGVVFSALGYQIYQKMKR